MNREGKLVVSGGTATLYMNLVSIKSSGLEGYLMQFDVLKDVQLKNGVPEKYSRQASKVISTYSVTDEYNRSGSSDKLCAGKRYPKVVSIPVDLSADFTWVHIVHTGDGFPWIRGSAGEAEGGYFPGKGNDPGTAFQLAET